MTAGLLYGGILTVHRRDATYRRLSLSDTVAHQRLFSLFSAVQKNVIIRLLRSFSSVAAEYSTFGNSSCTVSHLVNMRLMLAVM